MWRRFGANLVVIELATAMMLLVYAAGLLGKSFYLLLHVEMGIQPENLAMLQVWGPASSYAKDPQKVAMERQVLQQDLRSYSRSEIGRCLERSASRGW